MADWVERCRCRSLAQILFYKHCVLVYPLTPTDNEWASQIRCQINSTPSDRERGEEELIRVDFAFVDNIKRDECCGSSLFEVSLKRMM